MAPVDPAPSRASGQGSFEPRDIPEAAELAPLLGEERHLAEPGTAVQRDRGGVRKRDPGKGPMEVLAPQRFEQARVEGGADAASRVRRVQVDARVDRGRVPGPRKVRTAGGEAEHAPPVMRNEDPMAATRAFLEPSPPSIEAHRL